MTDDVGNKEMVVRETAVPETVIDTSSASDGNNAVEKGSSGSGGGCCHNTRQFFLYDFTRPVIQAFYLNQFGRSSLFISFMFLSLCILQLANEQAGCPINEETGGYACTDENKVYGARPSSILALMAMVGGVATSVFMPYFGAIVDYSDYRRGFGRVCAALLVLVNFVQIFIYENTWFVMTILQAVVATASFYGNSMVCWSYVSAPTDHDLHGVTSSGRMWESGAMFFFFIVTAVVTIATGWDAVTLARFAQALAVFLGAPALFMAYHKRYPAVKALKTLPEGSNLYSAGVGEIWHTFVDLGKTAPAAQRFLITIIFLDAAVGGFTNMAIIYLTQQLELSSTEVVIFILINLLTNISGVWVHRTLARKVGHKKNFCIMIANWIVLTALFLGLIAGPKQRYGSFAFAALYGYAYGHYYPSTNGYFVSLVPEERLTELWGWNIFASVILSWAPPLIFTAANETTGNLRVAMLGMFSFLCMGFALALTIPSDSGTNAVSDAKEDVDAKDFVEEDIDVEDGGGVEVVSDSNMVSE